MTVATAKGMIMVAMLRAVPLLQRILVSQSMQSRANHASESYRLFYREDTQTTQETLKEVSALEIVFGKRNESISVKMKANF